MNHPSYHSFLVRLWREPELADETWLGEIEFIQSGAVVSVTSLEEALQWIRRASSAGENQRPQSDTPPPQAAAQE